MMTTILLLIFLSFCIGTGVWIFFLYAVKRGEFDDIEGAKFRMLEDDDDPPQTAEKNRSQNENLPS